VTIRDDSAAGPGTRAGGDGTLLGRRGRLDAYGLTVFGEMSALADATGAINLGQGFPDSDGPPEVIEAAVEAVRSGKNQYPPGRGVPTLLQAIADHESSWWGLEFDPATEILVTAGATEAIAAAVLGLCQEGDEVVIFEPYYDSYAATIELAGARRRVVPLRPPRWTFDPEELEQAVTPATRLILLNTPHNPSGRVLSRPELEAVARLCRERDLIAVADEVYEHLVFDGTHLPLSAIPGMRERTVRISSAGKTFSATGWKIGWVLGPAQLVNSVRAVKQFLTYASGTPFQHAVATGLRLPAERFTAAAAELRQKRDRFCDGLEALGWTVGRPEATYFAIVDIRQFGALDGFQFCRSLVADLKVAAVPLSVLYDDKKAGGPLIRFAFCKSEAVLDEAVSRLATLKLRT
jgi:N-succinyldiaminopimelate aminotransferase